VCRGGEKGKGRGKLFFPSSATLHQTNRGKEEEKKTKRGGGRGHLQFLRSVSGGGGGKEKKVQGAKTGLARLASLDFEKGEGKKIKGMKKR